MLQVYNGMYFSVAVMQFQRLICDHWTGGALKQKETTSTFWWSCLWSIKSVHQGCHVAVCHMKLSELEGESAFQASSHVSPKENIRQIGIIYWKVSKKCDTINYKPWNIPDQHYHNLCQKNKKKLPTSRSILSFWYWAWHIRLQLDV